MPEAYERYLVPVLFRPFAEDLARRAAVLRPRTVLELAAGTGALTSRLVVALPGAEVVATDLNEAMVAFGGDRVPSASWRQADAQRLPFADGVFDLVVCQFGAMFFPDKPGAFAEVRRVLAPEGRFLFNTWGPVESHAFDFAVQAAAERAFPADPPDFLPSLPHGYHDPEQVSADLATAGLELEWHQPLVLDGTAESAAAVATGFLTGTPLRAAVEARGGRPDDPALQAFFAEEMTDRLGSGQVTAPMAAQLFRARPANA
ncbi:class I SAM-dependent methyltransferase [Streptomyces sp. TLI_171]|uniref:class I SAM-dependent methyltransferase n=1 Tax=Streptomyces sp. TLI_171 TaxID=1938859 RepID=UPI000C17FAF1|nr:class I SAM-dependent methyltransferase [Streptomyces sp. TLI_171]